MSAFRTVDTFVFRTPLGVRCLDNVTQKPIREGMHLSLRLLINGRAGKPVPAFATTSGIFGFQNLGLLAPDANGKTQDWEHHKEIGVIAGKEFLLCSVPDMRFLGCCLVVTSERLTADTTSAERKQRILPLQLFPTPQRTILPGMTAIRGRLLFEDGGQQFPAANVRVEARYASAPTMTYTGISDVRGEFAVFAPMPSMKWTADDLPNAELSQRGWKATLTFAFEPVKQTIYCISPQGVLDKRTGDKRVEIEQHRTEGWQCLPEIASLFSQQNVPIVGNGGSVGSLETMIRLRAENALPSSILFA